MAQKYVPKEQDETPEEQLSEVEIGNHPEKEFRVMIVKITRSQKKNGGTILKGYKKCLIKS